MGLEPNSNILPSRTMRSQANEDIACQLLQLLASQFVSSVSQLLAPLSLPSTTSHLGTTSSVGAPNSMSSVSATSASLVPDTSTSTTLATSVPIVPVTYSSTVTATTASNPPATSAPIAPATTALMVTATLPALQPPAPTIPTATPVPPLAMPMPSIPVTVMPLMSTQQAPACENITTPLILDTQLAILLQQYLLQAVPSQQSTIQLPSPTQTIQRVTISNLSPASEQGTAAPNMLDPCNHQLSLSQLHPSASQWPAVNAPTCTTLPVPTQLRQQIINGEYIDFGVLLSKCSYDNAGHATSTHTPATPISSLATWMEAWNIYAMVMLKELLAYQSSASKFLPLHAWLKYDRKFRALATANPTLRWDYQFSDYWLEAITARQLNPGRWPCLYCKSTAHYSENCPKSPFQDSRKPPEQPSHRANDAPICGRFNRGNCTRQACKYQHICISCKGKHPIVQSVSSGEDYSPHTGRSLTLECDTKRPLSVECDMTRQGSIAALAPYNDHLLPTNSYERPPLGHLDKHSLSTQLYLHSTVPNSIYLPIITVKPSTPLLIDRLIFELSSHPNHSFIKTLIDNLTHGCHIGYKGPHFAHTSRNLPAVKHLRR